MRTKWLLTLVVGFVGCSSSAPESSGVGGAGGSAVAPGGPGSAGSSAGSSMGGSASGAAATGVGGAAGGGTAGGGTAGSATGGVAGSAATGGAAGSGTAGSGTAGAVGMAGGGGAGGGSTGGSGGAGTGGAAPGAAAPSTGCGVMHGAKTLTTGGMSVANGLPTSTRLKITTGGASREYIIDIPADYDPTRPYRLIFSWHQAYGSNTGNATGQTPAFSGPNFNAANYAYFGLHREATAAKQPAIFVAPAGIGDFPWSYARDIVLFDDLLALVTSNLCIDENRVFSTGFSFGAMMSYALSVTRQNKLRGVVAMAPANWNFPVDAGQMKTAPIAFMGTTGMSDGTCAWISNDSRKEGGKYCSLKHAEDNGCTIPSDIQTAMKGSKKHVCFDFEGCKSGYPVKTCTFDGAHTPAIVADGSSTSDDGLKSFIPPLAWKFISQL